MIPAKNPLTPPKREAIQGFIPKIIATTQTAPPNVKLPSQVKSEKSNIL